MDGKDDKAADVLYMSKYLTFIMGHFMALHRLVCLFARLEVLPN